MSTLPKVFFLLLAGAFVFLAGCEKEEFYEETRLFSPVLSEPLEAELNTIIVNLGNSREAVSYTVEVSRDSFASVLYTVESDTNYVVLNEQTIGESLLYATLYQVRATAHAPDPAFDSRTSDLGDVRTERFPSPLFPPTEGDLLDGQVRVRWQVLGAPITYIRVFAGDDERLITPLNEFEVDEMARDSGVFIVNQLSALTSYQIAIYSGPEGETLRGWEFYNTTESAIDLNDPNVIDLSNSSNPDTLTTVVNAATDGQIIVLQKGFQYNFPGDNLDKSITFTSASGFGEQKPILYTTGNWNFVEGSNIDHVRFIDLELRGEDYTGDYVFNPSGFTARTVLRELTFENCVINNFRGIIRIRNQMFLEDYTINNSIVHTIGGYGAITTDTDGPDEAAFANLIFTNSTFAKMEAFITSRQNSQSVLIDNCTMNEFALPDGIIFRWRGEDGVRSNVLNGITITNSIWGPAWDLAEAEVYNVRGIYDGLESTSFTITNNYATENFAFTEGTEIPGFPNQRYNGTAEELWVAPYDLNFNFDDTGFAGINDAGDPRWRPF